MIAAVLPDSRVDAELATPCRDVRQQLDGFLRDVEGRAYRLTVMQIGDTDEALDIVQEAMIALVRRYARRSTEEWPPLFYRILQNRIRDWFRRQSVKRRVLGLFSRDPDMHDEQLANAPGPVSDNPADALARSGAMEALQAALGQLPARQREAFVLRNLEGLDVRETAAAMGCSDGSVKTHYSRAVTRLREALGEHWS